MGRTFTGIFARYATENCGLAVRSWRRQARTKSVMGLECAMLLLAWHSKEAAIPKAPQ